MANIKDIIKANQASYKALKNPDEAKANIGNYEFIGYKFDDKSNHGGIAFYNPLSASVMIAHRGSATKADWLSNNPKILLEMLGKPRETLADVAAKRFTNNILEMLDRENIDIKQIITTGHSKGGRESAQSLIEITDHLRLNATCLTINSAPLKNPTGNEYNHVNLQLSGGSMLNTDIVSVLGNQLGENYKIISNEIKNPIAAHSLGSFEFIEKAHPLMVSDDISNSFKFLKDKGIASEYVSFENRAVDDIQRILSSYPEAKDKNQTAFSINQDSANKDDASSQYTPLSEQYLKNESISTPLAEKLHHINSNGFDEDFNEAKDKRFFIDPEAAVLFAKDNHKDIQELLEQQSTSAGYHSVGDYMKENAYFKDFDEDKIDRIVKGEQDRDLDQLQQALASYAGDTLVYDYQYFTDMQQDIQENYASAEMYIFLSDEDSQSIVFKDNIFMDDEKPEMDAQLQSQVFDKVEQVEEYLEANESMLQSKLNKINLIDMRDNPNISAIKNFALDKLNHVKEEISELKTLHTVNAMPLGESKSNVVLVDTDTNSLYSVSKGKILGHALDMVDIIKTNGKVELFHNGKEIETKLDSKLDEKQKSNTVLATKKDNELER